ncbi:SDR family NAD(P)-dependent oxidoreductase [Spirillospora sp. CA-255316]
MNFHGKVVLITGGGSGVGRATALAFARKGATVVVSGRTETALTETVKLVEQENGTADHIPADVTTSSDVQTLVRTTVDRHGSLDIAFNNAGALSVGHVADIDEADWNALVSTNLTGMFLALKYEIAHMREHGGGVIVNTSSIIGPHLRPEGMGAYAATKAAVSALTRTAARENIGAGIRINALTPGPLDTPMSMRPGETPADREDRFRPTLPLGRVGTLDEAASTVLWLASPESSYVVGQDLVLDGATTA